MTQDPQPKPIEDVVVDALRYLLDLDPERSVTDDDTLDGLGADSLDLSEVALQVEEDLGVNITDEALNGFKTVGDMVKHVKMLVEQEFTRQTS